MELNSQKLAKYAAEKLGNDLSGHGFDHAKRVARTAKSISQSFPQVDLAVVEAAGLLHDTIDDKVVADSQLALQELQLFLESLGYSEEQIKEVTEIITRMSFSSNLAGSQKLSLAGKIVQDADRLDALGAIGIMRMAYFGGSHGHPLHDPEIAPIDYQNKNDYRKGSTVINHFYEKLLKLADTMNTEPAKKEARRRQAFMEAFLQEFYAEWDG